MKIKELLQLLDLGNSVAEFDADLENYFVETETFRALINDRIDIVAGDKGTGKTAIYTILQRRYSSLSELQAVEVITGFNIAGNPVFQRLTEGGLLTEGQYITIWKAYILSLVGNWILQIYTNNHTNKMKSLDKVLSSMNLRSTDDSPSTVFSRLINVVRRITNPTSAEVSTTLSQDGMPVLTTKVEFGEDDEAVTTEDGVIRHETALGLLNKILREEGLQVWVALDRLDEAFQGFPQTEIPALRALMRTYLDLLEFNQIKIKLFVRKDLFRKITQGGFVNLTHINARKIEIIWEQDDLVNLLIRRIKTSKEFISSINADDKTTDEIFNVIFPAQVDAGSRRPRTLSWIMSRIRDGNNVKPPRNLIDLVKRAQEAQIRREDREPRDYVSDEVIIEPEALKSSQTSLSEARVEDTLIAESGEYARFIQKFRDGKSEYNERSLITTLDVSPNEAREIIKILIGLGFLEQIGTAYKVPLLYRDGLSITQGKAV